MKSNKFRIFSADGFICRLQQKDGGKSFKEFGNYFKTKKDAEFACDNIKYRLGIVQEHLKKDK